MANTGNIQQQINYGSAANDGQGDPLRTAFIKTDDNFDNIWLAGPVGSNITIVNNTIQSNNTNGNIVLRPNGVGAIQANAAIVPNATDLRDLGTSDQRWRAVYIGTGGLAVDGNVTITGNLTAGNISYTGNVFVGDLRGSVYADDSTIMVDAVDNAVFANSAVFGVATVAGNVSANYFIGNGSLLTGITSDYGNANVAAFLPTYTGNLSVTDITIGGNITLSGNGVINGNLNCADTQIRLATGAANAQQANLGGLFLNGANASFQYFVNDGAWISNIPIGAPILAAGNSIQALNVQTSNVFTTTIENQFPIDIITNVDQIWQFAGNILRAPEGGTWQSAGGTEFISSNANGFINLIAYSNGVLATELFMEHGFIRLRVDNGGPNQDWNFNVSGVLDVPGDIIPQGNGTASLGNSTNYWSNLWVANNTIYIGGVPLGITGNTLTVNGEPVGNVDADLPTYGGNVLVDYLIGNTTDNSGYLQWSGNSSGDLNGYTTLRLVPDDTLVANDQYLIIDPTDPYHIHIRAGGTQDSSQAELFLGGEANYVRVVDGSGVRLQNQTRNDTVSGYSDPTDFNTGTWYESAGTYYVQYTTADADLITVSFQFNDDNENTLLVYYNGGATTAELTSAGSVNNLGGGVYRVSVNEAPPANPTAITELAYTIWTNRTNSVQLQNNDFTVSATDDVRITGADSFRLVNDSSTESIQIITNDNATSRFWDFGSDGNLSLPAGGYVSVSGGFIGSGASPAPTISGFSTAEFLGNVTADNFLGNIAAANVVGTVTSAENLVNGNTAVRIPLADGSVVFDVDGFVDIMDVNADGLQVWGANANVDGNLLVGGYASVTGNVTAANLIVTASLFGSSASPQPTISGFSTISATGNITGGNIITGVINNTGDISVTSNGNIEIIADNDNGAWGFFVGADGEILVSAANLATIGGGNLFSDGTVTSLGNVNAGNLVTTGQVVGTGNITGGNLIATTSMISNVEIITGNVANASATKTRILSDGAFSYIQTGNGTADSTGNIVFSPYQSPTQRVVINTATGDLTAVGNITGNTAGYAIGYRDIPQISFTGNATMAAADAGKHFYSTQSTDYVLTIADNSAVSWPVGTAITVVNRGTGNITVAQATGVSLYLAGNSSAGNRTVTTYGMATVLNVAANVWMINGTGVS